MVDKYLAKKYVADKIGEKYIIPTFGVWNSADEIDFDSLPEQFVLKCNHNSGGVVICKDKSKLNIAETRLKLSKALKEDYYLHGREWPYKNVPRKIIAEKYMGESLNDYKLMCFNGKVKCNFVCSERTKNLKVTFFDNNWKKLPFIRHYPSSDKEIAKPANFDKMIELSEILSKNTSFLRVDFYEIAGKIYFGELTFFPGCGFEEFSPEEWDEKLGSWIKIEQKQNSEILRLCDGGGYKSIV